MMSTWISSFKAFETVYLTLISSVLCWNEEKIDSTLHSRCFSTIRIQSFLHFLFVCIKIHSASLKILVRSIIDCSLLNPNWELENILFSLSTIYGEIRDLNTRNSSFQLISKLFSSFEFLNSLDFQISIEMKLKLLNTENPEINAN